MTAIRKPVELLEKNRPRQDRAKRTYENILLAAAELLVEVGVERISTNLIAERAGITVPALYRYFPNKYAVLHALGASLMDQQNQVFDDWFDGFGESATPDDVLAGVQDLLTQTMEVTRAQPGGAEILQALRAVAPLQRLRLESHAVVSEQFGAALAALLGWELDDEVRTAARVSVDVGYSVVEMSMEECGIDTHAVLEEGARMIKLYWRAVLSSR